MLIPRAAAESRNAAQAGAALRHVARGAGALPSFDVQRRGVLNAAGERIDFPDDREFARCWHVGGEDKLAVRRLFSLPVRRLFTQLTGHWKVVAAGRWLLVYPLGRFGSGGSLTARNFDASVDTAARIVTALTGR